MTNWIWLTAFKKHIVSVLWKHWKGVLYRNSSPKNENALNIYPLSGHLGCRWVCFFTGTDLEKYSMTSLAHQWILCSEWVPSEWESKQLIKTSQVIHTTPVHQLTSCELKSCVFVRNNSTIYHNSTFILTLKHSFWPKYQSIIHNYGGKKLKKSTPVVLTHQNPLTY